MFSLEQAIAMAAQAHEGQLDKAGAPYIFHPMRIMLTLETFEQRMAAILHDVVEDTELTLEDLSHAGVPEAVVAAVDALTKRPGETRMMAAQRAVLNPIARVVKLADVADNMNLNRLGQPTARDLERLVEYEEVKAFLLNPL